MTNNFVVFTNSSGNRLSFGRKNLQRNVLEQKGPQKRKSCSRVSILVYNTIKQFHRINGNPENVASVSRILTKQNL